MGLLLKRRGRLKITIADLIKGTIVLLASCALIWLRCHIMGFRPPTFQKVDNPASFEEEWMPKVRFLPL